MILDFNVLFFIFLLFFLFFNVYNFSVRHLLAIGHSN